MGNSALSGLRVVEISHAMAGELTGMVLADNGADVVKVEPPGGSSGRGTTGFAVWNRGKRSVVADLSSEAGSAALGRLVADADVVTEDLRPATRARLGIDYDDLRSHNPELVYLAITGFGERGPLRDLPGYEFMVSAAAGRMADIPRIEGGGPSFTPAPVVSFGAAMLGVQGVLAALYSRQRGGGGQRVHTSLAHALVTLDMTSGHGHRIHTPDDSGTVYGVMPLAFMNAQCKDGSYLQMCSRLPHLFRKWMRVLDLEHLYDDPGYAEMPDILPSQEALDQLITTVRERMAERTRDEWLDVFSANGVGANPFLTPSEFLETEQAQINGSVAEIVDEEFGHLTQIGPIARFSETPSTIGAGAPPLGPALDSEHFPWAARPAAALPGAAPSVRRRYPLDGLLIVEAAFAYATPQASTLLAEMGARVIKVEPPGGDPGRRNWRTTYTKEIPGKESLTVDLKTPEGRAIMYDLVRRADVFTHNFRPGVPAKLGVDYETLRGLNDRLVYVYGSCFGSTGPWSHLPGFHSSPNALAGTGILEAGEGNAPQNRTFGDPTGAFALGAAIVTAVMARERTGKGQYVEGTMLASLAYAVAHYSVTGGEGLVRPPLVGPDQRGLSPWVGLYDTVDGVILVCAVRSSERDALLEVLGLERMRTAAGGMEALQRAIADRVAGQATDGCLARLGAGGVPAVRADGISLFDFMLRSEHMRANDLSILDDIDGVGPIWRSSGSVEFSSGPIRIASPTPLGSDTARVLAEIGRSPEEIADLEARGVTRVQRGLV